MDSSKLSALFIVAAASLWGVIGVFSRELNAVGLTSLQITDVRCFITAAMMAAILSVYGGKLPRIDPRDIWMFIGTGFLSIVIFNILYFETAELVSLSMPAVLLYTAVLRNTMQITISQKTLCQWAEGDNSDSIL